MAKRGEASKKDKEICGEIRKGMEIYGYRNKDMSIFLHCCENTFIRRMRDPEKFTLRDMRIMGEKLHIDFGTLI